MNGAGSKPRWLAAAGLVAVVLAVFGGVRRFDFVRWDDDINITQNPLLTAPWSWPMAKALFSAEQALRFKPVHWLVDRAVFAAAGFEPVAWHALNLGLHLAATLLFFAVLRRMLARVDRGDGMKRDNARDTLAALGAGLWAVHPLRAEPVAWATASPYPLTAVWLLASFWFYLAAHEDGPERRGGRLAAAWVLAVLGYASYPVGATFGLWLVAVDVWWLRVRPARDDGGREWRAWLGKHTAFLAPAVLATGVTVWTRFAHPGIFTDAPGVGTVGIGPRLAMALATLGEFVWRLLWPVDLTPNVPPVGRDPATQAHVIAAAALAVGALFVAWRARRRRPGGALVVIGGAALALPCLGLTERPTWPVDRYSYLVDLVLVGGAAGLALAWMRDSRRRAIVVGSAGVLLLAGWGAAARRQAAIWRDSETLFAAMTRHPRFRDDARQAGHVYVLWGREEAGQKHPERAAELFGRARAIYLDAIKAALARGDPDEALSLLSHIEHFFGLTPELRREKGAWLLHAGRVTAALPELRAAAAALPHDARAQSLLVEAERKEEGR